MRGDDQDVDGIFAVGLREERLLLQMDIATGRVQFFPRPLSLHSEGSMIWIEASGRGKVVAVTLSRISNSGCPLLLAWIRLEEGVRILARVEGEQNVAPGETVSLTWQSEGDEHVPVFKTIKANGDFQ
jgi:uncharacterized OB-fold protein